MTEDVITLLQREVRRQGAEVVAEVSALQKRLYRYSNLPGVIKGLGKLDFSDALVDAALQVVRDADLREPGALQQQIDRGFFETWAVISLAARSDPSVIDEAEATLTGDHVPARIRELRRVTDKALARRAEVAAGSPSASDPGQGTRATPSPTSRRRSARSKLG